MGTLIWPDVDVQPRPTTQERYVRSYVILRALVGALGILLPPALVLLDRYAFSGRVRSSLSAYYYSGVRELFVGVLWAIGVFLITYKVADTSRENRLSTYAGSAAIVVALFPTGRPGQGFPVTPLQDLLGETWVERIHFVAAAIFFGVLAVISYYFAKPGPKTGNRSPSFWRRYHLVCAALILLALILAGVTGLTDWPRKGLLIAEWLAVWAFGASWFMKGFELDVLLGRRKVQPEPS